MAYIFGMGANDEVDYNQVLCNSLEALEKRINIQPLIMDIAEVAPTFYNYLIIQFSLIHSIIDLF